MVQFSLIIPTLNESGNIIPLLTELESNLKSITHEIIVVDDDSPDGTASLVEEFSKNHTNVSVIRRQKRNGLSAAVINGFEQAKGTYLGVIDADFSHDFHIIPKMVELLNNKVDLAIGSRRIPGGGADFWPWHRRLFSSFATFVASLWLDLSIKDPMSGFFLIRHSIFEEIRNDLNPKGYKILLELAVRSEIKNFIEVPYIFKDRRQGQSKLTSKVALAYLSMLWDLRKYSLPLKFFYRMGQNNK